MLTLYQLPPGFGLPVSVSPYCAKVEIYLRLTERPFETALGSILKSPTKQVPYVRWSDDSVSADSGEIIARLEARGPSLDEGLTASQRAGSARITRLAQHEVYYSCLFARFAEAEGWRHQRSPLRSMLPPVIGGLLAPLIRRSQVRRCRDNGFAETADLHRGVTAVEEIERVLGTKPHLFGDAPRVADCAVWANLLHTAYTYSPNPPRERVRGSRRLVAYIERLAQSAGLSLPALSDA